MAVTSSTSLTKYESAVTIVTAAVANSWYGGLFGTTEGAALSSDDPLVAGHVHDGAHIDGHAQKIDLVDHVTGQLRNVNLADDAVTKRNVSSFTTQSNAIPEFEIINGTRYYFLDLSSVFGEINLTAGPFGAVTGDTNLDASDTDGDLEYRAGPGIGIDGDAVNNRITLTNLTRFDLGFTAPGSFSGTQPLVGPVTGNQFTMKAGAGMEIQGDAATNSVTFVNQNPNPTTPTPPTNFNWLSAGQGFGWGNVQNRTINAGLHPDDLGFFYKIVPALVGPVPSYIYFNIAAPRDPLFTGAPVAFVSIRAYFVTNVAPPGPSPFSVEGWAGSSDLHPIPGEVGCLPSNTSIIGAATPPLWEQFILDTSPAVGVGDQMIILDFPFTLSPPAGNLIDLNGLFLFKMAGIAGFGVAEPWNPDGASEVNLLGISYDWRF